MDSEVFDNVKYEKAKAMVRFNRFRKMTKLLQFIKLTFAFTFISCSWTHLPAAIKLSSNYFLELSVYIFNPHVVFLIGNAIILVIVLLCRQTEANNQSATVSVGIHHENVPSVEVKLPIVTEVLVSLPAPVSEMAEHNFDGVEDKQIVCSASKVPKVQSKDIKTEIEATKKEKIYTLERTQSEKLKRSKVLVNPQKKLRRAKTADMSRIVVPAGDRRCTTTNDTVDTLSNEEFQLTIEAFIKKNQIFFEKQRVAETEHKKLL